MLTVIPSIINFFSGSAFQGIVNAVTGVIGKLSSDQATEPGPSRPSWSHRRASAQSRPGPRRCRLHCRAVGVRNDPSDGCM